MIDNSPEALKPIQKSKRYSNVEGLHIDETAVHFFTVVGASGDLAKRKTYQTLWFLYNNDLLPPHTVFFGFARSNLTVDQLRKQCEKYANISSNEKEKYNAFWSQNKYIAGEYDKLDSFIRLNNDMDKADASGNGNRIFYLALPFALFEVVTSNISRECKAKKGWTRIILEKPFGHDDITSVKLTEHLKELFTEKEIYRIDHYLGKEMVQNLLVLRFANLVFDLSWNREYIACVQITFKEVIGTSGRAGYFDKAGIIRDIMQNHILQILSLVCMEKPLSMHTDHIRDEKVNLLNCIAPINLEDVVLGQYVGNPEGVGDTKLGYLDDPLVPRGSITATYAAAIVHINNNRWKGVPVILKCGKALDERKTEIRIQYKDVPDDIFGGKIKRNELVIRVQPSEAVYLKMMHKTPGMSVDVKESELDLTYGARYKDIEVPEAYHRLLLDVFIGSQVNFVRSDELSEAWRIVTPVLREIDEKKVVPFPYVNGSRGPEDVNHLLARYNFQHVGSSPIVKGVPNSK